MCTCIVCDTLENVKELLIERTGISIHALHPSDDLFSLIQDVDDKKFSWLFFPHLSHVRVLLLTNNCSHSSTKIPASLCNLLCLLEQEKKASQACSITVISSSIFTHTASSSTVLPLLAAFGFIIITVLELLRRPVFYPKESHHHWNLFPSSLQLMKAFLQIPSSYLSLSSFHIIWKYSKREYKATYMRSIDILSSAFSFRKALHTDCIISNEFHTIGCWSR